MNQPEKPVEIFPVARKSQKARALSSELVAAHQPLGVASEAYRMLRTNLLYSVIDNPPKSIVLTSAGAQEGKSVTCANLGIALKQVGKSVLILDCDLRKPMQHDLFGLPFSPGLVDVLAGERDIRKTWQEPIPGLKVVTAGHRPPNPAEVLSSRRLAELLSWSREEFDYVLVDAPPVRLVSDSAILAKQGDGVLLVLDVREASKKSLRQAVKTLDGVGANVIGTVMNNVKVSKRDENYGYIGRYYGGE